MTDPIADMIIRLKNALLVGKVEVVLPHSKLKEAVARLLLENNYLESVDVKPQQPQPELVLVLKYVGKLPAITDVKRVSKPGRRLYAPADKVPQALGGYGITIVSTSKGVITDAQARKLNVGGEVMCQIW